MLLQKGLNATKLALIFINNDSINILEIVSVNWTEHLLMFSIALIETFILRYMSKYLQ